MTLIEVACFPSLQSRFARWAILKPNVFFLKKGESTPVWPQGSNSVINVEPADTCCGNPDDSQQRCMRAFDYAGYTVIVKCQDIDDPSLTVKSVRTSILPLGISRGRNI
jgi:hypothetical protein